MSENIMPLPGIDRDNLKASSTTADGLVVWLRRALSADQIRTLANFLALHGYRLSRVYFPDVETRRSLMLALGWSTAEHPDAYNVPEIMKWFGGGWDIGIHREDGVDMELAFKVHIPPVMHAPSPTARVFVGDEEVGTIDRAGKVTPHAERGTIQRYVGYPDPEGTLVQWADVEALITGRGFRVEGGAVVSTPPATRWREVGRELPRAFVDAVDRFAEQVGDYVWCSLADGGVRVGMLHATTRAPVVSVGPFAWWHTYDHVESGKWFAHTPGRVPGLSPSNVAVTHWMPLPEPPRT